MHAGVDLACGGGAQEVAVTGGNAVPGYDAYGYGNFVDLQGDDGNTYRYGHLASPAVAGPVKQGDPIGVEGASGDANGAHLHFEVRPGGGGPVDPCGYISCP